jgi:hypothetical protein
MARRRGGGSERRACLTERGVLGELAGRWDQPPALTPKESNPRRPEQNPHAARLFHENQRPPKEPNAST